MKKIIARIIIMLIIFINTMPVMVFAADGKTAPPDKPYEKVAAKSGNWYSERLNYDGSANLVVGYLGQHKSDGAVPAMEFEIKEKTVIKGIYLPFIYAPAQTVSLQLTDSKGNIYQGFASEKTVTGLVRESSDLAMDNGTKVNYIFTPVNEIVLPAGEYTITLSDSDGAVGAFLIKGINYSANEKYKEDLRKWEAENNGRDPEIADKPQTLGNEGFIKQNLEEAQLEEFETPPAKKPAAFLLDAEYMIDEIIINTFNSGNGALPGTISVNGETGDVVLSQQASGGSLGDIANGIWKIAPDIVLPAGNYFINISDPGAISYDKSGEPLFYVKASVPVKVRCDFTGTYKINLDAYKTSTLMGSVSDKNSSFSLKDFELTVLDKDGEIEVIGKYEGMPFSQACEIVEEDENTIAAKFNFAADLSKLPYKANISANAIVTLTKPEKGEALISIKGTGRFQRAATAEKGADDNTYSIISNGVMAQRELPAFVMTALGKSESAGNIPGPDNAAQAAAGILFPPLVGVAVSVAQELLKPKPRVKPEAKAVMRDKNWYKKKYPNLSEESLAMVMLGDAMGSTDNPDEGDAVSVGDNEKPGGSDYVPPEDSGQDIPYEEEPDAEVEHEPGDDLESADEQEYKPEPETEKPENQPLEGEKPAPETEPGTEMPEEPETMVLQTSANGAQSMYVKDPETGEWINAETGGVLDYEKYKETAANQFAEDKKINDEEFGKNTRGETENDRINREEMKKISDNEKWETYKDLKKSKYGIDSVKEINTVLEKRAELEKASFEKWQTIGNINAVGEVGATIVGATADAAIDGLSSVTPGGDYIKAGYKVSKGIAGTMAEKGMNKGSFVEGAIKGGTDAATDFVKIKNPYVNAAVKATVTVTGESGGSAAGAYIRGGEEDWQKAGAEGLVDGVFKAGVGAVTDGLTNNAPDITLPKGSVNIIPTMKNVLVNKTAATKIGSSLTDEFAVKPIGSQPIKDEIGKAFKNN